MPDEKLLALLEDQHTLFLAGAASSAYVMRSIFERTKPLRQFAGRADLAAAILERLAGHVKEPRDPAVIGLHLYALELTGASKEMAQGAALTLRRLKDDPLAGQLAAHLAATVLGQPPEPGAFLLPETVEALEVGLEREVGQP
jgi:hypothetical protein